MIEEVCEGYHTMNLPHIVWAVEVPSLFSGLSKRRTLQSCCVRTPGSPELGPVGNESSTRAARCGVHGATAIINHGLSWSEHKLRPSWSRSPLELYLLDGVRIVFAPQTIAWQPTRSSCTPTWRPRRTRDHGTDHPHCMVNADRAQTSPTSTAARWRGAKHIFTDTANATARAAYLSQRVRRRTHLSHKIRLLRPESNIARPPQSQITFHSPARLHSRSHVLILIISLVFALVIVIVLAPALALGALLTIGLAFLFLGQEAVLALVDAVQHLPALGRAYVHVEHAIADGV